jgi:hypothetical protein
MGKVKRFWFPGSEVEGIRIKEKGFRFRVFAAT